MARVKKRTYREDAEEDSDSGLKSNKKIKAARDKAAEPAPAEKTASKGSTGSSLASSKDDQGNTFWQLSPMRRITLSNFKGSTLVSLREYYEDGGVMRPGRKGIALTIDQYQTLLKLIPALNAELGRAGITLEEAEAEGGGRDQLVERKANAAKKSNIEATSDEDSG